MIFMYIQTNDFDKNNKERIYNLLVLKGEALQKGELLRIQQNVKDNEPYKNFFTTISLQIDPLLIYFINDEISASLHERGPLRDLIKEVKRDHSKDEHLNRLQAAEEDLPDLFANRTTFIIGSSLLDFKVNTFSVFEFYINELYDLLLKTKPRSAQKEKDLLKLIDKYSKSNSEEEKLVLLSKIKKISFYVSSSEKIEYVLSRSGMEKKEMDEARIFLNFYRDSRNTIHNLGIHHGENKSVTVGSIEINLKNGGPSYTENYNSAFYACRKLMDIYESIYNGITGKTVL